jgi:hypothetical protein
LLGAITNTSPETLSPDNSPWMMDTGLKSIHRLEIGLICKVGETFGHIIQQPHYALYQPKDQFVKLIEMTMPTGNIVTVLLARALTADQMAE